MRRCGLDLLGLAVCAGVILIAVAPAGQAQEEGLYADFDTSMGGFTCRLEPTRAPRATANFISLATGERAWVEEASGQLRNGPFYSGLLFHRVIAGFMIQGGSPNGQGTDGPGYAFPDEFSAELRHDGAGVLSMANSGPNSNGSQFFVTVTATPWLDDVHTVFGRVTEGLSVVTQISQVSTDTDNRPASPVVLRGVTIRRVGEAAAGFDAHGQGLPVVSNHPLRLSRDNGSVRVEFDRAVHTARYLSDSSNLRHWTGTTLGIDLTEPALDSVVLSALEPAHFYSLATVTYPSSTFAPRTLAARRLVLDLSNGQGELVLLPDAAGGGSYEFNGTPGWIESYVWTQDIYRGRLWPVMFSHLVPMTLRLDFQSAGHGVFSGTAYAAEPFEVSGQFTLSDP
jgi:cyclophilin family peptidyl-prolyl cis-trans isomerase